MLNTAIPRWSLKFAVMGAIALAWAGLGCLNANAQQAKLFPVKVGTLKQASLTDVWVAKQAGIFEKNGLDVELIEFRTGQEAIAAQRGGHVDIALSIPGVALIAIERGFDLVMVSQNETAHAVAPDSGAIIVLKDSPITNLSQLAGKKIAISGIHTQKTVAIQTILRRAGVEPNMFQFVEIPFASHPDLLKSGQVDAVASLDPWTTQMQESGLGRVLAWDYVDSLPEQPIGAWFIRSEFSKKNPDVADRFARAIHDAIEFMHADEDRARRNVAAYTGLDPSLLKLMPLNNWDYRIKPHVWQAMIDMMKNGGELQRSHKVEEYLSDHVKPYIVK
jgi:NitT/TauT family transport system substrate-binding protein